MPPAHDGPLPKAVDVAVVGGGIVGVMTAWHLAQAGVSCVVLEKGRVGAEQSSRNWGWIRCQGRDPAELPIAREAQEIWRRLAAEADCDIGLRQTGTTYVAATEAAMAGYLDWRDMARAVGLGTEALSRRELLAVVPAAAPGWVGAIRTATDLRAEPQLAMPALARLAVAAGAQIREGCAVRGLDIAAGRVAGVVTERGRIAAGTVVVAGGAWSRLLLARHRCALPQLSVRSTVVATLTLPLVHDGQVSAPDLAFRRRLDGGYSLASGGRSELFIGRDAFASFLPYMPALWRDPLGNAFFPAAPRGFPDAWGTPRRWAEDTVSPFERMRVLNPAPSARRVTRALARFSALFPELGTVRARVAWAGMIDAMPDVVPVVDRMGPAGLIVATGMSGHGFGIGPAFGRIAAALATGGAVGHVISRFRSGRFADGSALVLGPAL